MKIHPFGFYALILFAMASARPAILSADAQSTSFKLESEAPSGGGVFSVTSTHYKVEEGAVSFLARDNLTSTSYKLEGAVGFGASLVPIINSITPGNFSKYFTDSSPSFTVSAQDPDLEALQYQLKMDGTVKIAFQSSSVLSHALSASDRGRHTYTVEVKDTHNGTVDQNQFAYVFRRPVK